MTAIQQLFYNTDRKDRKGETGHGTDEDRAVIWKLCFLGVFVRRRKEDASGADSMEYIRRRTDGYGYRKGLSGYFPGMQRILRANLVSEDGKEATVCRIHPGELCVISASCLLPALPFDIQIDAETDSEVYLLPTGVLRQIMERICIWKTLSIKRSTRVFPILSPRSRKSCLPAWNSVWQDFYWMSQEEAKTEKST